METRLQKRKRIQSQATIEKKDKNITLKIEMKEKRIKIESETKDKRIKIEAKEQPVERLFLLCDNKTGLFEMPALRNLLQGLIEYKIVKTISITDLYSKSKLELCKLLQKETRLKFPLPDRAPYKEIENVEKIPAWAWDPVRQGLMYNPHVTSAGRAYFSTSITNQVGERKDPLLRTHVHKRLYADWNLREAIKEWIFKQTGYFLEELEKKKQFDHLCEAEKLYSERKYGMALTEYEEAFDLSLDIEDLEYNFQYSVCLGKLGKCELALKHCNKYLAAFPDRSVELSWRARMYFNLGRYEEALKDVDKAIEICAEIHNFFSLKGEILTVKRQYADALQAFEQALKLSPNDVFSLVEKGYIFRTLKRNEDAVNAFDQALKIEPTHEAALKYRAWALCELKRYPEALVGFDLLCKNNSNDNYAYGRGVIFYRLGKYEEALKIFASLKDDDFEYSYAHGMTLLQLGNYELALELINKCIEDTDFSTFLAGRAQVLEKMGRKQEALENYLQVRQDADEIEQARDVDDFFNLEFVQERIKCLVEELK